MKISVDENKKLGKENQSIDKCDETYESNEVKHEVHR